MKVNELIEKLNEFNPDLELSFVYKYQRILNDPIDFKIVDFCRAEWTYTKEFKPTHLSITID